MICVMLSSECSRDWGAESIASSTGMARPRSIGSRCREHPSREVGTRQLQQCAHVGVADEAIEIPDEPGAEMFDSHGPPPHDRPGPGRRRAARMSASGGGRGQHAERSRLDARCPWALPMKPDRCVERPPCDRCSEQRRLAWPGRYPPTACRPRSRTLPRSGPTGSDVRIRPPVGQRRVAPRHHQAVHRPDGQGSIRLEGRLRGSHPRAVAASVRLGR